MATDPTLATAVENLLESDENQLFEQLGIRMNAMRSDPAVAGTYDPAVSYDAAQMGVLDDVRAFGKRVFGRWNREAWELVCGTAKEDGDDRQSLLAGLGVDKTTAAAALAALLVGQLGMAPALAAVVAALVVKRFFRPVYDEFCSTWKGSLPAAPSGGASGGSPAEGGPSPEGGADGGKEGGNG